MTGLVGRLVDPPSLKLRRTKLEGTNPGQGIAVAAGAGDGNAGMWLPARPSYNGEPGAPPEFTEARHDPKCFFA